MSWNALLSVAHLLAHRQSSRRKPIRRARPCVQEFETRLVPSVAVSANDFLNSLGVNTHFDQGAENLAQVEASLTYTGIRNIRDGGRNIPPLIAVYNATGAQVSLLACFPSITNCAIPRFEQLAAAGALLAAEGPNEPNNFPVTYNGQTSGYNTTFLPVAQFQSDLYTAVTADPNLAGIPVFASSEAGGAEPDNVGLQYLTIPNGSGTLMPDGTIYADYANTHNYVHGNGQTRIGDNQAWNAESPGPQVGPYDGMHVEYGRTWHRGFTGYSDTELVTLPKVTTETGWATQGTNALTEDQQGKLYLNLSLDAFTRGWSYTFIYELRDGGGWGIVHNDYTPKLSADYLHNLTTILADNVSITPDSLNDSIPSEPATVHDLLLEKSDGTFELAVWNERASGSNNVTVNLGDTYGTVNLYDPTVDSAAIDSLSNVSSVSLTLSDHPVIIEIPPAAGPRATGRLDVTPLAKSHAPNRTQHQRAPVIPEAIAAGAATGLSAAQISILQPVQFVIAALPAGMLGEEAGTTNTIDRSTDGYGWSLGNGKVAPNKLDLLTVVSHELGLPDLDPQAHPGDVMDNALPVGVRRLPSAYDAFLLDDSVLQALADNHSREDGYFAGLSHRHG